MWRSDARTNSNTTFGNMNAINVHAILEIQKEIDPCDMISLVFLLYDVPDTALQRLVIYERVYKDNIGGSTSDLLHQWALHAQSRTTWKHEFLEALVTCQLNKIIRKLGFNVADIKKHFEVSKDTYINPMKKLLYTLCENIVLENLSKLKNTLLTYDINTVDYENCELIFLDLMCRKFINFQQYNYGSRVTSYEYNVDKLADILENFKGLEKFAQELKALNSVDKSQPEDLKVTPVASTSSIRQDIKEINKNVHDNEEDFSESFDLIEKLMEDVKIDSLKSDKTVQDSTVYEIKNPNKVGICYIINQEHFYPSKSSIENNSEQLNSRKGSTKDKDCLKKTMSALNFEVITDDNLDHKTMLNKIENILKYRVQQDHSIFILCILSHGTKGHIYAADSVSVKVETIENLLDGDGAKHLQGMPKVVIFQACQVIKERKGEKKEEQALELVPDAPKYYIKKSDILLYSATAPGYEAYRLEKYGSIFIQILCKVIEENADTAHLEDIFTKVRYFVHKICTKLRRDQLPKQETTLLKKLHLKKIS